MHLKLHNWVYVPAIVLSLFNFLILIFFDMYVSMYVSRYTYTFSLIIAYTKY